MPSLNAALAFDSLPFILFSLAAVLLYRLLPVKFKPYGHILFGAVFVLSFTDLPRLLFLFLFVSLIYFLGAAFKKRGKPAAVAAGLALIVAAFFVFKLDVGVTLRHPFFSIVGISYICLKLFHYLTDLRSGAVDSPKWAHFLAYIFFYPSFLAGPITRYQEFTACYTEKRKTDLRESLVAAFQIASGVVKKFILSAWLFPVSICSINVQEANRATLISSLLAYSLYIYLDFSGYTDIARGLGKWTGADLPPNFRYPYLRKNLIEFWTHWHISLSQWLRDYIYLPFSLFLNRKNFPLKKYSFIAANLLTMFVCGLWHGVSLHFMAWGVYHGAGLSAVRLYDLFLKERNLGFQKKYITPYFSCFVNFCYVTLGWVLFVFPLNQALNVLKWILWGR